MTRKLALAAALVLALGAVSAGIAIAAGDDGDDAQAGSPTAVPENRRDGDGAGEEKDSDELLTGSPVQQAADASAPRHGRRHRARGRAGRPQRRLRGRDP